jgi:phage tail P2-like protein
MKTRETDLKKLIPLFMRDDPTVKALVQAINDIMATADPKKLRTWDQLENMTHEELDELAWELNVLWYNAAGTLKTKREQIRTSDDVWRTLGTRHAIETVISQLFIKGKLLEFWEYGGQPHHFMVECYDPAVLTPEGEKEFRRIVEIVKRKSQILDSIRLVLSPNFYTYTGVVVRDITTEKHSIG